MARNTPPTLVSYTETVWNTFAASKSTASISWQTNDVLVMLGVSEGPDTVGVPTATGLTFTSRVLNTTAGTCGTRVASAVAASSSSGAVSATNSSSSAHWGFAIWVWRSSDGIGTSAEQHTSTKTKALVATDTHSAVMWGVFDFAAAATTGVSLSPTPTNTDELAVEAAAYTAYVADLDDQSSGGSTSYGISGGSSAGPFSIAIFEVLGSTVAGGATAKKLAQLGVG